MRAVPGIGEKSSLIYRSISNFCSLREKSSLILWICAPHFRIGLPIIKNHLQLSCSFNDPVPPLHLSIFFPKCFLFWLHFTLRIRVQINMRFHMKKAVQSRIQSLFLHSKTELLITAISSFFVMFFHLYSLCLFVFC